MWESRSGAPWPLSKGPRHSPPPRRACRAPVAMSPGPSPLRGPKTPLYLCLLALLPAHVGPALTAPHLPLQPPTPWAPGDLL